MPGVFGTAGSGVGTLGASAGNEAFAIGPGSCANDCSLAVGNGVTAVSNSICIGHCDISHVQIGCYNLSVLQSCLNSLQNCFNDLF